MSRLNSLSVQKLSEPGRYSDGHGLYLQISKGLTKSWIFRYSLNKKPHEMGLGPYPLISLAEARSKALDCRKSLLNNVDPLAERKQKEKDYAQQSSRTITFAKCAELYIESQKASWKNKKHCQQWENTIQQYAKPIIGHLPVSEVDTSLVMKVLQPIWYSKTETASRLRGRIESILAWATVHSYREGMNPAQWRNHLDKLLPKRTSVQKVEHFAALPIGEVSSLIRQIRSSSTVVALALEFQILTASRPTEAVEAKWTEINLEESVWTIPADRMKAKREHRVPLSPRAIEILLECKRLGSEYVFPGRNHTKPLSNNALLLAIKNQFKLDVTVHGFRSTFRDWSSEYTSYPHEVVEMCLAHTIKNKVEAAYRRGDLLLKRRLVMNEWAEFCSTIQSSKILVANFDSRTLDKAVTN